MANELEVFLSNRLEVLYQHLKSNLFGPGCTPFMKRIVVVYGPAMKTWISLRMAQDPELQVAMGIEFLYLHEAFESLLKLTSSQADNLSHVPTRLELALAIEKELMVVIQTFKNLSLEEQQDWTPLVQYLKINLERSNIKSVGSRKIEKRLIALSKQLARLFQDYGRFAPKMVLSWKQTNVSGWQPRLWQKLFAENMNWTYPSQALLERSTPKTSFSVHFFSISFVTASEFAFLKHLSEYVTVDYYLLSPCAVFWSDVRSDRESAYMQNYWQKQLGTFSPQVCQLEELLRDRNPLLANFGRLGREMAYQIEESFTSTFAQYVLPEHVKSLNEELFVNEELYFSETETPLSLLHAVQADILMMRNPQDSPAIPLEEVQSVQLHIAPNKRREIQILYQNLLGLIANDSRICPSDIIVMAPQIGDYIPYIQSTFGISESQLDFQVLDLGMQMQSEIVQGFLQLLELSQSRWNSNNLLQLLESKPFQRRLQLVSGEDLTIQKWVKEAGIRWGEDWLHRNELLQRNYCAHGMVEDTPVGTWDYGLSRLLMGLTSVVDESMVMYQEIPPCSGIDFSQSDLLGKWIHLLHSLRDDLSLLEDQTRLTMEEWTNYLTCLLENYFQPDFEDYSSIEEYEDLKGQFEILRSSARSFKDTHYSFTTVKMHLIDLLQSRGMTFREDHLQAVRFCSLVPLRSIPSKVIALLGMKEGAFPRSDSHSSLNLMVGSEDVDYVPSIPDYDRYLFLEALHSAQDFLILSYEGYGQQDGKELHPSLIVEEFFSYLDKSYTFQDRKISEFCIYRHPFDAFDPRYFMESSLLPANFSHADFLLSQTHAYQPKAPHHCFLDDFKNLAPELSNTTAPALQIDLKHLSAIARNPIKFHLNHVLEIYLQTEEDRQCKTEEEFLISALDKYQIRHSALKEPLDAILHRAEKKGKLPFGLFKTVAAKRIKEEVMDIQERLQHFALDRTPMYQIEFCSSCLHPAQIDDERWICPAVKLTDEEGRQLSIVGKLSQVTSKGLIVLSKGALADAWKVWPQFLLYCHAVKVLPGKWEPHLILVDSKEPKKAFFDDPIQHLKNFVRYHSLCLQNFSPLMPEWLSHILQGDKQGWQDKMRQSFSDSFGGYQNKDLVWVLNKNRLPNSEEAIHFWKSEAESLLGDMVRFWYNSKSEKL